MVANPFPSSRYNGDSCRSANSCSFIHIHHIAIARALAILHIVETVTGNRLVLVLKYWPTQGKIDFLAYAPHKEGQNLNANTTAFDFTVAKKAADQIDLLWANATGKITESFEGTTKEKVKFLFKHALSRLGYTVKLSGNYSSDNATFTLKKITLAVSPTETTKVFLYKGYHRFV